MLEAKSLRKALVPPSLLQNPSPANLQSTRLALHVNGDDCSCSVYIASGCRVYKVEVTPFPNPSKFLHRYLFFFENSSHISFSVYIASGCHVYKVEISMEDSGVTKGKESLLIPVHAQVIHSSLLARCPHRSEIQSVVLAETHCRKGVIGTVDSYGHLIVSQLDANGQDVDRPTYTVLPQDCGVGEGSWAGMCFSPSHWSMAAVARSFCKSIDVYDQDIPLRSLNTLWYPTSLCFMWNTSVGDGNSSILAVAEGCQLTIWDLRTKHNGGCVQRICGSVGDLFYAVCGSSEGAIAIGGSDRTVTIYDPRRWSALSRWANCSKYEITGLSFSSLDSNHIYVQGVDYEVFCGQWKESRKVFSFRGDSNWLGFNKCLNNDVLSGWSESGSIFVAEVIKEQQQLNI
ncbi:uncharacterized protein LOC143882472 isoform X2 [Tasmannia lanceolata]|uniref:uncharacterized protein LOC143882472 isoform X2 n=1 Tax=Tasmannia lanceolata TaxID=3420 RepID=UPI004063A80B